MSAEPPKLMILDAVQAKPNSGGGGPNPVKKVKDKIPERDGDMEVTDLDPESVGTSTFPRSIEVQSPTADGAKLLARWSGDPTLSVGDFVDCRQNKKTGVLEIEGYSGGTAAPDISGAWPSPDKIKIGSTEYDTIAAANAAYGSGDVVIFGAGTFTLSANTTFAGAYLFAAPGGTTISGSYDFIVNNGQAFGLTFSSAVAKTTTGTTTWDRCEGDAGIDVAGTEAIIRDCNFHTVGLSSAATTTRVFGGRLYDVTRTAGDVYLNNADMIVQASVDSGTNIYGNFMYLGRLKSPTVLDDRTPTHHFRSGSAPYGFIFTPSYGFTTPSTFSYSFEGDFLRIRAGTGLQSFLVSQNTTLQGKIVIAALQPSNAVKAGIRMVGAGGNYFEFYVQHAGSGSQLSLYLDENGAVTGPEVTYPVAGKLGLVLNAVISGSYVRPVGYVIDPAVPFRWQRAVVASIIGSQTSFNVFNYGLTGYGPGSAYWDWFYLT